MTIKVHELAKELKLSSKDVLDKANAMGIEAKSHMSVLSDIDAIAVRNTTQRAKADSETKIVKVAPKKVEVKAQQEEPRVTVKAAMPSKPVAGVSQVKVQPKREERTISQKPPVGRSVGSRDMENRPKPPIGKPIISKDLDSRTMPRSEGYAPESIAATEKPIEKPVAAIGAEKPISKAPVEKQEDTGVPKTAEPVAPVTEKPETAPVQSENRPQSNSLQGQNRSQGDRPQGQNRPQGDRPQGQNRPQGDRPQGHNRPQGDRPQGQNRQQGDRQQGQNRSQGDRPQGQNRQQGDKPPYNQNRQQGDRPQGHNRPQGDRPQGQNRPQGDRSQGQNRSQGDRRPYGQNRPQGDRPGYGQNKPQGDRPSYNQNRPQGDRPSYGQNRPQGDRPQGDRPYGQNRPQGDRPYGQNRPQGQGRPQNDRPESAEKALLKPGQKRVDTNPQKGKERDKYAKLEGGKKNPKAGYIPKSLEKQAKPKRHKPTPKPVVEPEVVMEELPVGTRIVNVPITVAGFCEQVEISTSKVIMSLMKMGIMANINQSIDEDMVLILAEELGLSVIIGNVEKEILDEGLETFEDKEEDLKARPPIITVMGHVDHGKTSLLDAIRKTNVTASESGGITQHIGASEVMINGQKIVFLDTPGHEAFTAMRARGAHTTDIAVLVVAADDSVKPQTIESISHAKAAGVPIIVAINKIDKPGANPDKVKQDLTEHGILVEEWGGDTISVPVSAKSGEGIVTLLEMILLQAEVLELQANPNRLAIGSVIEARLDKSKGPVATLLVLNGTLQSGMSVVAGTCSGKIRLMTNYKGDTIKKAGPATAVEILGLTEVPEAGDEFNAVKEDRLAREIAENRKSKQREEVLARNASTTLEQLFSQIQEGETKELNLIIKGDVQGSVGALVSSLEKMKNENVSVRIIHTGVGTVTESDVMLAGTSGAIIIGFNVRPSTAVTIAAEQENVQIRTYRVIYNAIDDIENAMKGMLDPIFKEVVLGQVEIRNTFKVPGIGIIGGAYVTNGKMVRNAQARLLRDGIIVHEGKISSLKRFKDDAKEVNQGFECGIGIESYNDIKEGDIIECFHMEEIERK